MSVSSSEEPLYTAVVEQCGTASGTAGEITIILVITSHSTLPDTYMLLSYSLTLAHGHAMQTLMCANTHAHMHTHTHMHTQTREGGFIIKGKSQITCYQLSSNCPSVQQADHLVYTC